MANLLSKSRFSVVLPVHNKGGLLFDALASISAQSLPAFEVIIIDDASSDDGLLAVDHFPCLPVRVLTRSTPGSGGYAARNLGINVAQGDWITFLDADDVWYPDHLAVAADAIAQYPQASVFCTGFDEDLCGQIESVAFNKTRCLSAADIIHIYANKDYFHTNSMVVRRSALIAAGGFPENGVRRGGDHSLWLRLILQGDPVVLAASITTRYRRDHSAVVANPAAMTGEHPVVGVVAAALSGRIPLPPDWKSSERFALQRLANRRALLWMLYRRRCNLVGSSNDLLPPYITSLSLTDLARWFIAVLAPPRIVALLQNSWRYTRVLLQRL